MQIRIGHGYDVHRFAAQAPSDVSTPAFITPEFITPAFITPAFITPAFITIGGVQINHTHGLLAHSDGDVLIHALCDAMLGALALGDIGQHFPDDDARYHNISSLKLLVEVCSLVKQQGWQLGNADMTIVAQEPKMSPHVLDMRKKLASCCNVALDAISVKATTTETLGFTGRKEGIACHAVVLLQHD